METPQERALISRLTQQIIATGNNQVPESMQNERKRILDAQQRHLQTMMSQPHLNTWDIALPINSELIAQSLSSILPRLNITSLFTVQCYMKDNHVKPFANNLPYSLTCWCMGNNLLTDVGRNAILNGIRKRPNMIDCCLGGHRKDPDIEGVCNRNRETATRLFKLIMNKDASKLSYDDSIKVEQRVPAMIDIAKKQLEEQKVPEEDQNQLIAKFLETAFEKGAKIPGANQNITPDLTTWKQRSHSLVPNVE